jgi:hypothetical protein
MTLRQAHHNHKLRHSNRARVPKHHFSIENESYMIVMQDEEEPKNIREALICLTKEKWMKVMKEETESMRSNNVWKLVDLPEGRKQLGTNGFSS